MNQRLQESITNEKSFARYNERLEEAWRPHEARIIREQARKDAQQEQATRDAAKAIIMFEKQEAERNPWIAASKMTAIQGLKRGQANRIADDRYKVPMIGLGLTRGRLDIRNANQRIRLSGGYGEVGRWFEAPTNEERWMQNLIGEEYTEEIKRLEAKAEESAKEIMGETAFDIAIKIIGIFIPKGVEKGWEISLFLYGVYQCLTIAYEEEICLYMREHNCSREDAKENIRPTQRFIKKFWQMMMGDWLNHVLIKLGIPMLYRSAIQHTIEKIMDGMELSWTGKE